MIRVQDLLQKSGVVIDLKQTDKLEAITSMARFICSVNGLDGADEVTGKILEREEMMSTGIGYGIAIPHARLSGIDRLYMAVARVGAGIEFNSLDGLPVNLIFIMVSPANTSTEHTEALSALSRIMSYEEVRRGLLEAETPDEFLDVLAKAEDKYVGA